MFMESSEEVAAVAVVSYSSNGSSGVECDYAAAVASFAKRKRTKRLRTSSSPPSPPPPLPPNEEDYFSASTTTEEEEDMAHCLILLAQGRTAAAPSPSPPLPPREEKFTSRKFAEAATTATGAKAGFYVYECKTCNKCFPSFQALGGHRASHKKPKLAVAAAAVKADVVEHDGLDISMNSSFAKSAAAAPPAPAPPNKLRVHECSICGSEFASGQALGGHMRRHRPVGAAVSAAAAAESPELLANCISAGKKEEEEEEEEKKCMMLSLDLNLPAPSEENAAAVVAFAGFTVDQRPLALVDCHY
ncbi:zinc finger protein ZAT5 [Iris pallida]|uniref:Zinc finger protein ZAT5 n=1 Tax=Iris pallida TaxID=29817 RepID=A0AAX6HRI5_IRIPA|nr:zinc finger protein ZAT5 [Iris pallida]